MKKIESISIFKYVLGILVLTLICLMSYGFIAGASGDCTNGYLYDTETGTYIENTEHDCIEIAATCTEPKILKCTNTFYRKLGSTYSTKPTKCNYTTEVGEPLGHDFSLGEEGSDSYNYALSHYTAPSSDNGGLGSITYMCNRDGCSETESEDAFWITKEPEAIDNLYAIGKDQQLITAGECSGYDWCQLCSIKYSMDKDFSDGGYDSPSNSCLMYSEAGTYRIYYALFGPDDELFATTLSYVDVTINDYAAPTAKTDLKYNGEAQELVNAGTIGETTDATFKYVLLDSKYSERFSYMSAMVSDEIPTATKAGIYYVWYELHNSDDELIPNAEMGYGYGCIEVKIGLDYSVTAADSTYDFKGHDLANSTVPDGYYLMYSTSKYGTYSKDIPSESEAGTYTVYYKLYDSSDDSEIDTGSVTSVISPMDISENCDISYDTEADYTGYEVSLNIKVIENTNSHGKYNLSEKTDYTVSYTNRQFVTKAVCGEKEYSAANRASFTLKGTGNFTGSVTKKFDIVSEVTLPEVKTDLVENKGEQKLCTAGSGNGVYFMYRKDAKSSFSKDIPTGTDIGTYPIQFLIYAENTDTLITYPYPISIGNAKISSVSTICTFTYKDTEISLSDTSNDITMCKETNGIFAIKSDDYYVVLEDHYMGSYLWSSMVSKSSNAYYVGTNSDIENDICCDAKIYTSDGTYIRTIPILIDIIEHSYETPSYSWADNGKSCSAERTCSYCGNKDTEGATITSAVKTKATCTTKGTTTYTAAFTNSAFATQTKDVEDIAIDSSNHDYKYDHTVKPTCTTAGYDVDICSWCGKNKFRDYVDATGHNLTPKLISEATCTSPAIYRDYCSNCDYVSADYESGAVNPDNHNYEGLGGGTLYWCNPGQVKGNIGIKWTLENKNGSTLILPSGVEAKTYFIVYDSKAKNKIIWRDWITDSYIGGGAAWYGKDIAGAKAKDTDNEGLYVEAGRKCSRCGSVDGSTDTDRIDYDDFKNTWNVVND